LRHPAHFLAHLLGGNVGATVPSPHSSGMHVQPHSSLHSILLHVEYSEPVSTSILLQQVVLSRPRFTERLIWIVSALCLCQNMEEMTRSHDTSADSSLGVGSEAVSEGRPRLVAQASNAITFASALARPFRDRRRWHNSSMRLVRSCAFDSGTGGEDSNRTCPLVDCRMLRATVYRVYYSTSMADVVH
jgi:hypothetical protein